MELEDLKELMELLKGSDVTELQIEKDGTKVRIKREKLLTSFEMPAQMAFHRERHFERTPPLTPAQEEDAQRLITVTAPIVGTFYRSPTPDAGPFVETGSPVKKGQVICIIEAMKLMNEIESEVDGLVVKCLVGDGHPVEYGEPLFLIEPN